MRFDLQIDLEGFITLTDLPVVLARLATQMMTCPERKEFLIRDSNGAAVGIATIVANKGHECKQLGHLSN